jgi:hypothetical protein
MAMFSKRTILLIISATILLTIALHYPQVEHERNQADSYYIHLLSQSIVDEGYATWTYHSLSYFGYYPVSYPAGAPFAIAELSTLTGLSVEASILLSGIFFSVLFCLATFCLASQFVRRPELAALAAILATLSPRLIDTTYWVGSARGPLVVLMTITIFVIIRSNEMKQRKLNILSVALVFGCFAMHHMAVLFVLFGAAYIVAVLGTNYVFPTSKMHRRQKAILYVASFAMATSILSFALFDSLGSSLEASFGQTNFVNLDQPVINVITGLIASYLNQVGIVLILSAIGLLLILNEGGTSTMKIFLIALVIAFIPILNKSLYVSLLLLPFLVIMGMIPLTKHPRRKGSRSRIAVAAILVLVLSSILIQSLSIDRWDASEYVSGNSVEVSNQVFSDAQYLRSNYPGVYSTANVKDLTIKMAALTQMSFMMTGPPSSINGDVDSDYVHRTVTWSEASFPVNLYLWFQYPGDDEIRESVQGLLVNGVGYVSSSGMFSNPIAVDYFSEHSRICFVVDNRWDSEFITEYGILPSAFTKEVKSASWNAGTPGAPQYSSLASYMTYQSEDISVFIVELPI